MNINHLAHNYSIRNVGVGDHLGLVGPPNSGSMNTDKGCGGVPKGVGERWPFEMEIAGGDGANEEECCFVKSQELFTGVSEYFNSSKLSDVTLIVGNQQ